MRNLSVLLFTSSFIALFAVTNARAEYYLVYDAPACVYCAYSHPVHKKHVVHKKYYRHHSCHHYHPRYATRVTVHVNCPAYGCGYGYGGCGRAVYAEPGVAFNYGPYMSCAEERYYYDRYYDPGYDPDMSTGDDDAVRHPDMDIDY